MAVIDGLTFTSTAALLSIGLVFRRLIELNDAFEVVLEKDLLPSFGAFGASNYAYI